MNPIVERVSQLLNHAIKSGDRVRIETLRMLRAAIIEFEKSGKAQELTEQDFLSIVMAQIKRRREAIEQYRRGGREDLAAREEQEVAILQEFLPEQLSPEALEAEVRKILQELGATSQTKPGAVMGEVMRRLKGRAEGAAISSAVMKVLGSL